MLHNQEDRPTRWSRLDNAATIFPPTSHGSDTGVFRLCCELREDVQPERLQLALEQVLEDFPHMKSSLRRGLFWYYLEQSGRPLHVVPEQNPPCARLYRGSRSPLLEVSFWRHKINLDIFHVLADGVGAISFFQALIIRYLELLTPGAEAVRQPAISPEARGEDGFARYYEPGSGQYGTQRRAYCLKGARRRDGALTILEGVADVDQILRAAHTHSTTLTVYLCAVLIQAIREEMTERDLRRPVVLTIPVDLRSYFKTDTARNFFGIMRVFYDFSHGSGAFEEILETVAAQFQKELTAERLGARMNALSGLQHQPLLRAVPLVLKNQFSGFPGRSLLWGRQRHCPISDASVCRRTLPRMYGDLVYLCLHTAPRSAPAPLEKNSIWDLPPCCRSRVYIGDFSKGSMKTALNWRFGAMHFIVKRKEACERCSIVQAAGCISQVISAAARFAGENWREQETLKVRSFRSWLHIGLWPDECCVF